MELLGITEIHGQKGVGKTNLALFLARDIPTLYITTTKFCIQRLATNAPFYISEIHSVRDLYIAVLYKIRGLLVSHEIKFVVIDTFDSLLFTELKSKDVFCKLLEVAMELKKIIYESNLRILILNVGGEGFSFSYLLNNRLSLARIGNSRLLTSEFMIDGSKIKKKVEIINEGVRLSDQCLCP